jgi:hypothetical protein
MQISSQAQRQRADDQHPTPQRGGVGHAEGQVVAHAP